MEISGMLSPLYCRSVGRSISTPKSARKLSNCSSMFISILSLIIVASSTSVLLPRYSKQGTGKRKEERGEENLCSTWAMAQVEHKFSSPLSSFHWTYCSVTATIIGMETFEIQNLIEQSLLFRHMQPHETEAILARLQPAHYPPGTLILEHGV